MIERNKKRCDNGEWSSERNETEKERRNEQRCKSKKSAGRRRRENEIG